MITSLKACRNPLSKLLKETAIKWPNVSGNAACSRSRIGFLPGADAATKLFSKEERETLDDIKANTVKGYRMNV